MNLDPLGHNAGPSEYSSIYALIDPNDGCVKYIGKANCPVKRFKQHLRETKRKYPVYNWIAKLRMNGQVPVLVVLETTVNWREAEIRIIDEHLKRGEKLLNIAKGGDQPYCSIETRSANARIATAKRTSTTAKARAYKAKKTLGDLLKRGYVSEATKIKMRNAAQKYPEMLGDWASI